MRKAKSARSATPSKRGRDTRVSSDGDRFSKDSFKRSPSPRQKSSVVKKQREAAAVARLRSFAKSVEVEARKLRAPRQQTAHIEGDHRTSDRASTPGSDEHGQTRRKRAPSSNATLTRSAVIGNPSMVGSSISLQHDRTSSMFDGRQDAGASDDSFIDVERSLRYNALDLSGLMARSPGYNALDQSETRALQQQVHLFCSCSWC